MLFPSWSITSMALSFNNVSVVKVIHALVTHLQYRTKHSLVQGVLQRKNNFLLLTQIIW